MLLTTTTLLSQSATPSPLWFGIFPKRGIGRGITSIFRVLCDKAKRGCASHVPPLARRAGPPHETGDGGGSDPPFWTLVRHRRVLTGARSGARLTLASGGSLPPQ